MLGGLPIGLLVGHFIVVDSAGLLFATSFLHSISGVAAAVGYLALIALLSLRLSSSAAGISGALVALGRRSMSFYLLSSIVFMVVLSPVTFALGAEFGSAAVFALAVVTWLASIALAKWLDVLGKSGPAETLLRRLSYGPK